MSAVGLNQVRCAFAVPFLVSFEHRCAYRYFRIPVKHVSSPNKGVRSWGWSARPNYYCLNTVIVVVMTRLGIRILWAACALFRVVRVEDLLSLNSRSDNRLGIRILWAACALFLVVRIEDLLHLNSSSDNTTRN